MGIQRMANYQVLFNGEVAQFADVERVRANLARELGLDDRKAKQLFSGRTVVIRSQLDQDAAQAWANKLADLGAICRVKDLTPRKHELEFQGSKHSRESNEHTLRDITAAHLECPRCGHMQLDSSNCARCGINLEAALRQKHKEDLLIEKKIRELRSKRESAPGQAAPPSRVSEPDEALTTNGQVRVANGEKKGVLSWFKR